MSVCEADGVKRRHKRTFGTFNTDLLALADWLKASGVKHVAMEATGVYWRPVWSVLEGEFEQMLVNPFEQAVTLWETIPGVNHVTACNLVAEIGVNMNQFPSAQHLASWAAICPGNNESADKRKSGRTRETATSGCAERFARQLGRLPGRRTVICLPNSNVWLPAGV